MATIGFIGLGNMGVAHGRQPRQEGPRGQRLRPRCRQPRAGRRARRDAAALGGGCGGRGRRRRHHAAGRQGHAGRLGRGHARGREARHAVHRLLHHRRRLRARGPRARRRAGMLSLDAPVSGGVGGAEAATLTFMVGGTEEAFERAKPILEAMGKRIVHCGEAGRRPGRQDLQQHDPRHQHDRRVRGVRAGREARPLASGAVRCGLDLVGPVLVAHDLLPGAGPGARRRRPTTATSRASPRP